MELKVWVEGIQRIVCGVTEATTCQDVVYALAHATGKTGRFTLIERWRSNERLLPPQEHPLQVLSKWGEYANDVQLVLRHARGTATTSTSSSCRATPDFVHDVGGGGGSGGDSVKSPQPNHANDTCTSSMTQIKTNSPQPPPPIRKSLTFSSGGSGGLGGRELTNHHSNNCAVRSNHSDFPCHNNSGSGTADHTFHDSSKERRDWSDVPRGVVKGIPQQQQQQQQQPSVAEQQNDVARRTALSRRSDGQSSSASENNRSSSRDHQEAKVNVSGENGRISNASSLIVGNGAGQFVPRSTSNVNCSVPADGGLSTSSKHNKVLPNVENASQEKLPSPRYVSPPQPANHVNQCNVGGSGSVSGSGSSSSSTRNVLGNHPVPVHLGTPKSRRNLLSEFKRHDLEEELQEDFPLDPVGKQERVIFDARYRDLVRLINLQREKLSRQQADLTQYDAEIAYWEEKQKEHQRQIEILECEIKKFEFTGRDVDEQVVQLDRLHLDDELEIGRQQENILSSELTLLRSKLSNCETELLQCKNKIRIVMDNISEDERWLSKEEDERKQREIVILNEIEMLQNDIQNAIRDYESKVGFQVETSDECDRDVKRLETVIADKKKQVENLVREMKQANLESLTFTSSDEIRQLLEGGAHKGPGSSRKIIGSPRQLENAVPTSKNPHGVWV